MSLLRKLLGKRPYPQVPYKTTLRELIQKEAKVGSRLFGALPPNRRREFFMLDEHTWIWYEEWREASTVKRVTTRYELHKDHVLKIQNDEAAVMATNEEIATLYQAIKAYYYAVADEVYHRPIPQN